MSPNSIDFKARDNVLADIFQSNTPYKIPKYQRPYDWSIDNAEEFINDLLSDYDSLFLGSFVFDTSHQSDGYVEVIDGQQRLTTINILLSALWHLNLKKGFTELSDANLKQLHFTDFVQGGASSPRLQTNEKIRDFFEGTILKKDWDETFSNSLARHEAAIRDIYLFFKDRLEKFIQPYSEEEQREKITRITAKLFGSKVVKIDVQGDEIAYILFEVLNARGQSLNVADLLKNYIFSKISSQAGEHAVLEAENTWREIEKIVEGVKKISMPKFIRYYWISKNSFVTEKNLYRQIKRSNLEATELLSELRTAAGWLHLVANGSREEWEKELQNTRLDFKVIHDALEGIRTFETTQCYVLFIRLLMSQEQIGYDFSNVFKDIARFHFGYSAIGNQPGNTVEKVYQVTAKKVWDQMQDPAIETIAGVQSTLTQLLKDLPVKIPYDVFEPKFVSLSYNTDKVLIRYIYDRLETSHTPFKDRPGFMDDLGKSKRAMKFNVDHLIPKDEKILSEHYPDFGEDVNLIGNLLVVEKGLNGWMSNSLPQEKLPMLSESKLKIAQRVCSEFPEDILPAQTYERAKALSRECYEKLY